MKYQANLVRELLPRVWAPAGELLLDAMPTFDAAEVVVEIDIEEPVVTVALCRRFAEDNTVFLLGAPSMPQLLHAQRAGRSAGGFVGADLDAVADEAVNGVVKNAAMWRESEFRAVCAAAKRCLKVEGTFAFTTLLGDSFDAVYDLVCEAAEAAGDTDLLARLRGFRSDALSAEGLKDILLASGFRIMSYGEEERAVGPTADPLGDPLFQSFVPQFWFGEACALPWEDVVQSAHIYFQDTPHYARVHTAVVIAQSRPENGQEAAEIAR